MLILNTDVVVTMAPGSMGVGGGWCNTALFLGLYGGTPDAEINGFGINRSPTKF